MKRILRDERGMALAVAIFALVVVGALVAGAFFAGTQEQRVGENQRCSPPLALPKQVYRSA